MGGGDLGSGVGSGGGGRRDTPRKWNLKSLPQGGGSGGGILRSDVTNPM